MLRNQLACPIPPDTNFSTFTPDCSRSPFHLLVGHDEGGVRFLSGVVPQSSVREIPVVGRKKKQLCREVARSPILLSPLQERGAAAENATITPGVGPFCTPFVWRRPQSFATPRNEHTRNPATPQRKTLGATGRFPGSSDVELATATTFGVDCGCDGSFPPTPTSSAPGETPSSSSTSAGTTCVAGAGVNVTSSEFPELEGCLAEIDLYLNNEVEFASDTGLIIATGTQADPDTVSGGCGLLSC